MEIANYAIVPYKSGECWQIERFEEGGDTIGTGRYKGKPRKPGWKKVDRYPDNLELAIEYIVEHALRERLGNLSGVRAIAEAVADLERSLLQSVKPMNCDACDRTAAKLLRSNRDVHGDPARWEIDQ